MDYLFPKNVFSKLLSFLLLCAYHKWIHQLFDNFFWVSAKKIVVPIKFQLHYKRIPLINPKNNFMNIGASGSLSLQCFQFAEYYATAVAPLG